MSEGRFPEARGLYEKSLPLSSEKTITERYYRECLLAAGDYDLLLKRLEPDVQTPERKFPALFQMCKVYGIRGNKAEARKKLAEAVGALSLENRQAAQKFAETMLCCAEKDVDGFLKSADPKTSFEAAVLRGQLDEAAALATSEGSDAVEQRGVLYLAAAAAGMKALADEQWTALLDQLNKGDRDHKLFGDVLVGRKPLASYSPQKLAVEPSVKRVLLAVLAQRYPAKSKELLALSRRLDYQRDAISLCLDKVLKK
jgi:hypothetical protein